ncbi:3-carboxy-cis,cis-muconate cycloisomerase [Sphaerisporangium krabiense]|uniref:3-carboxy-cis,cis-muconate cycloisomerase n=1 Tax=Sphaerisporangium krabiense TaxID=763782 RepID=A0A7W8Z6J5_9ACTN|nr:3-carboxy-cis,cis-muconate cycloisomerase [Sphaerisporangium krabiense]MBB5628280.1 3-carboxy-cis,cis-muconate cycloisomerase [Sphaerisporangium krabiense]GII66276.1 3-carboxy-cis,cis-muconate cycloisomerase [Sphaerisporangium krabiense]
MSERPSPDAGLLSPVRAGTAVEAVTSDEAFLRGMLDAEAALARAQAGLGLVPAPAAEAIGRLCEKIEPDVVEVARRARGAGNPLVPLLADLRAAADPSISRYIHRGATSQDIVDTAAMLVAARAREIVLRDLDRVLGALAGLAAAHRDTPMAGRTLGQHAVPITFGLKAAGWLLGVLEARTALREARTPAQLGGAAGTLEGLGPAGLIDAFAAELGLAPAVLPWHTRRTPVTALGAALAAVTGALGKIAQDVVLLAQNEVGEVAEPSAPGRGGSSAMAHKRNPVLSIMIRSAAAQAPALTAILHSCAATAEHERPAGGWHAEWQPLRECLRLAGGAAETAAELCEGLEVFPARMRENLETTGELSGGLGASADLVERALEAYRRDR